MKCSRTALCRHAGVHSSESRRALRTQISERGFEALLQLPASPIYSSPGSLSIAQTQAWLPVPDIKECLNSRSFPRSRERSWRAVERGKSIWQYCRLSGQVATQRARNLALKAYGSPGRDSGP